MDILNIDTAKLTEAAGKYKAALQKFQEIKAVIEAELQNSTSADVWDDASKAYWDPKANSAKADIAVIESIITKNAQVLEAIANAVNQTETSVKAGISQL